MVDIIAHTVRGLMISDLMSNYRYNKINKIILNNILEYRLNFNYVYLLYNYL